MPTSSNAFRQVFKVAAKLWDNAGQLLRANATLNVGRDNKTLRASLDTVNATLREFHGTWPLALSS